MERKKYLNKIYDGRWKVIDINKGKYLLENIYNLQTIILNYQQIRSLEFEKTTVSKIISRRIKNRER